MTYARGRRRQKPPARPSAAASAAGNPWRCGACGFHCTCPWGFVTCECRRIDMDVDDARGLPSAWRELKCGAG
jgi:hypothetical protein